MATKDTKRIVLTAKDVERFADRMSRHYGVQIVYNRTSHSARIVARFLALIGVADYRTFVDNYAIQLGRKIYVPFCIGRYHKGIDYYDQVICITHECQHVVQRRRDRFRYQLRYVFRPAARASYEAEAYGANIEMRWYLTGEYLDLDILALHLRNYRCKKRDIRNARARLELILRQVERGHISTPAAKRAVQFLMEMGKERKRYAEFDRA